MNRRTFLGALAALPGLALLFRRGEGARKAPAPPSIKWVQETTYGRVPVGGIEGFHECQFKLYDTDCCRFMNEPGARLIFSSQAGAPPEDRTPLGTYNPVQYVRDASKILEDAERWRQRAKQQTGKRGGA